MKKLILLPGMDGTGILFQPFLEQLEANISVQVMNYPGTQELSYADLTQWVLERLPDSEDYHLLAESFSGPIAYQIALKKPRHLKKIIFVASFIQAPNFYISFTRFLPLAKIFSQKIPKRALDGLLSGKIFRFREATAFSGIVNLVEQALVKVEPKVMAYRIREMRGLKEAKSRLQVPVVYLQASRDDLVSNRQAEIIASLADDFQYYPVEGSHFILQTNPQACIDCLRAELV